MRSTIKNIVGAIVVIAIILFFSKVLIANWSQIEDIKFTLNFPLYLLSTLVFLFVIFFWGALWNLLLKDLGHKQLSFTECFKIQAKAWFGKYLPGKVGVIGIKFYLGAKNNIDSTTIGISTIYENIFQIITAFLVSVPILLYYSIEELKEDALLYQILPIVLIAGLLVFIHPKVFFYFVNSGLKLLKKQTISQQFFLSTTQIVKYIFLYSFGMIMAGIAFFLFINSISSFSTNYLILSIGIFNFAGIIGLLAIFVPAGIGIREGVIVLLLKPYMPYEMAIVISVASRFWTTIADGLLGLYILVSNSFKERPKVK